MTDARNPARAGLAHAATTAGAPSLIPVHGVRLS